MIGEKGELCFVKCLIAGVEVNCLVDSGATINIVSQSIFEVMIKRNKSRGGCEVVDLESFGHNQIKAFEEVKQKLKDELVTQAFFDNGMETYLYTDASGVGLGAVLTQKQPDDTERVISYASKSLTKTEQRSRPRSFRSGARKKISN